MCLGFALETKVKRIRIVEVRCGLDNIHSLLAIVRHHDLLAGEMKSVNLLDDLAQVRGLEMHLETSHLRKIIQQIDGLHLTSQQVMVTNDREQAMDVIESAPNLADPDPFDLCLQGETKAHLAEAISKLSEREQLILSLYYREELTMKEIAADRKST